MDQASVRRGSRPSRPAHAGRRAAMRYAGHLRAVGATSVLGASAPAPPRVTSSMSGVSDPSLTSHSGAKLEIQLLHDRVLVKMSGDGGERRSSGGIVIPATAQVARRLAWGDVLGVGNNVRNIKVDDRVLFNPEDQYEVEIQGQAYLVMRERDVHAIASERTEHGTGLYL